ncbi:deoxynucleoside kinase [Mycoplasmopsis anatis]|uniref:Deoxyguanosine kinase n=1 Tax=Mycoplasmopsis anatis 1340 TaxID=1034808 RepID=F9QCS6_9BACT|nr:deoxynucleoside kinase [Mycoplasmopsis anatis]AWX69844.1 deoxynucleoside kinase [Mycoplasmopsis anatis]EGS29444.1 deoxyguanosine kinase [Mycoplasmopsis anatis 1340]VEU73734.1 Deoxyguanosine kinase [Mycoplasmopsis anatis]
MLIGISGMISSGKSTLTSKLVNFYGEHCLFLNEYEHDDEVFNTFLKWLYDRKNNIGLGFQTYVIENHLARVNGINYRFNLLGMDKNKEYIFLDRFCLEHYIFALVNLKTSQQKVWLAYQKAFEAMVSNEQLPELVIYLDISFETFKQRIMQRGREVEINNFEINKEYFNELHSTYKTMFLKLIEKYKLTCKIINTNNMNEDEVFKEAAKLIEEYTKSRNCEVFNE